MGVKLEYSGDSQTPCSSLIDIEDDLESIRLRPLLVNSASNLAFAPRYVIILK